ncbi:hypothetical protein [Streptomyces sp. NBC_01483]|uniref:hypothetical protein n=1 Tax=Streptomyces sp. NBC_01483 TaxID=2903883 RepID=UPI002E30FFA0|nr:hypothetical protein [Streptomyces sp. NBC_01483]
MILALDHTGVDPPSAYCSCDVFGGCEGGEWAVARRDEAAELLFLVVSVKGRELDQVEERLVTDIFQGVQEDLVVGLGRPDLDVADAAGTLG